MTARVWRDAADACYGREMQRVAFAPPGGLGTGAGSTAVAADVSIFTASGAQKSDSAGRGQRQSVSACPLESVDDGGSGTACRRAGKADLVPLRHALRADDAAAPPPSRATVSPTSRRRAYTGGAGSGGSAAAGILEGVLLHRQRANEKESEKARGGLGQPRFEVGDARRDDVACHDFFAQCDAM